MSPVSKLVLSQRENWIYFVNLFMNFIYKFYCQHSPNYRKIRLYSNQATTTHTFSDNHLSFLCLYKARDGRGLVHYSTCPAHILRMLHSCSDSQEVEEQQRCHVLTCLTTEHNSMAMQEGEIPWYSQSVEGQRKTETERVKMNWKACKGIWGFELLFLLGIGV